jgi:ribosomal protein S12 methylthiotransferase
MYFYLLTLGCPKNEVDSEGMQQLLLQAGYQQTDDPRRADVLIVNTCGFIDVARQESLEALRALARRKRRGQALVAAGCLVQRSGVGLAQDVPALDGFLSTRRWAEVVGVVEIANQRISESANQQSCQSPIVEGQEAGGTDPRRRTKDEGLRTKDERLRTKDQRPTSLLMPGRVATSASAYLKIADGCDAPCAFCAIPAIKGRYASKPVEAILEEARQLVAQGVQEIVLIAQDTTLYGRDLDAGRDGLARLLESIVAAVPALPWLRVMYTYPTHITPRLVETMARLPQVCHYLDIPLQHAHPAVLRRMHRPSDLDDTRRLLARLRAAMPDIALRTTFIVGYPGETEEEFQALLNFLAEVRFDHVGVFPYSAEEGTPAAGLPGAVPAAVRQERYRQAMTQQQEISRAKNQEWVGQTLPVLIEGEAETDHGLRTKDHGLLVGRSFRDAPEVDGLVLATGQAAVGTIVPVHITAATEYDLWGEVVI